ncbi:acetoacetate decarboxylase family protein [Aureivirga sp. CE67]|uniref:acetoacetate decarboxylase family protein n=1 Tax=Aureivirga sp. CE67 TaxID=1788983 RepID=UPI0018CB659C|nr:acetoacetate decarboxylase family protein [Aureivirga sp. CE67]
MKNFKLIVIALLAMLASCSEDDDTQQEEQQQQEEETQLIVTADFDFELAVEQNKAVVTLINSSENATNYEWSFPDAISQNSAEENPIATFTENGTFPISLTASNGEIESTKSIEITIDTLYEHVPYKYLENDGIFMYYETDNEVAYQSLIPDEFEMPSRMLVFAFINDFYKLDYDATPYKENAIFILVEYQGVEYWHCVYMPVTDEVSMWAGIIGLGLPKTLGEINFTREEPLYYGDGTNPLGGTMEVSLNTENYTIDEAAKQEMIELSTLKNLQFRNGEIIVLGKTGTGNSIFETADQFPSIVSITFGEAEVVTNTESIPFHHPLDLTPSNMIGAYYLINKASFSLTGDPF